ncbi:hypothetical protein FISHEDRAFT_51977 [Fistulina hepatica ATCC 64428]|nr:hypothetical protein FISHEDRAFT_51977 [Fistulina hepatica ATCC 64428]
MVFAWYPDPATSLHNAVPFNFIIKRTMWFDVLAAVTLQEPPVFVDVYRQVFRPTYSGIVGEGVTGVVPRELDMMNVMGCANHVCWALAEASVLSYQASEGLTVREVYRKITEIEGCLQPNFMPPQASSSAEGATGLARQLSADIFRAATLLYLHAILERDQPANPEIKHDVDEVMAAFGRAQEHADVLEKVARTTVFALFLAGALTTRRIHRQTIVGLLQYNRRGRVGNRWTIERTLGDLWKDRNRNGPSVDWRKVLRDNQLLLV